MQSLLSPTAHKSASNESREEAFLASTRVKDDDGLEDVQDAEEERKKPKKSKLGQNCSHTEAIREVSADPRLATCSVSARCLPPTHLARLSLYTTQQRRALLFTTTTHKHRTQGSNA
ncbi:hypothetical protein Mapa_005636 [Marchantia paleacea]|nr:hypothetical protein Mapa_005636 [Marchantia paleacea]